MKIVYLSRNMEKYGGASYQQDVMDELARQTQIHFYGPGFEGYDVRDSIDEVLAKAPFQPNAILLGHAWLNDRDGAEVDPHPRLDLSKTDITKAVILNKEYVNLEKKLDYIRHNCFDLGFTHHHDTDRYMNASGTEFTFWPFAYDPKKFRVSRYDKTFDLVFSGILQNLNLNAGQSDIRVRVMAHIFHTCNDVPLFKKKTYTDLNIFWNSISRKQSGRYLSKILRKRKYLNDAQYAELVRNSKMYVNTLSPMGLVSPRFFECMASGALVFCEESDIYRELFSEDIYVTFKKDLSDFDDKLFHYLAAHDERITITEKAREEVLKNHTWKKRVGNLLREIKTLTGRNILA